MKPKMKTKSVILLACLLIANFSLFGQEIQELKEVEILSGKEFRVLYKEIESLKKTDTSLVIKKLENTFSKTNNDYTRCKIMEELGPLYVSTKQFEKCLNM